MHLPPPRIPEAAGDRLPQPPWASLAILLGLLAGERPEPAAAFEIPWSSVPETVDSAFADAADLVTADLDNDGVAELAGAGADGVVVWTRSGAAWTSASLLSGTAAQAIVTADLDSDGLGDLAAPTAAGVSWWRNGNGGAGLFSTALGVDAATTVVDLASGDLDGDGDPDLVGALPGPSGAVRLWLNAALTWTPQSIGALAHASSVAVADFDHDGDLDVVASANGSGDRVVFFENTAGDASAWVLRTVDGAFDDAEGLAVADLDRDGHLDVVASGLDTGSPVLGIWLSDGTPGNGGFTAATTTAAGLGNVTVADLDRDGDPDLAQAAGDRVDWWESAGDGITYTRRQAGTTSGGAAVLAADLDADGGLDLAASSTVDDDVLIWTSEALQGSGSFLEETTLDSTFAGARAVHAGDLDGDGDLDVVGDAFEAGVVRWWRNTPAGFVASTIDDAAGHAVGVRAADLDADGDLDVIGALGRETFQVGTNKLVWWRNDGGAPDPVWTRIEISGNINLVGGAADPWPADMDMDGDLDVLLASAGADRLAWWENTAGDASAWSERLVADPFNQTLSVVAADLDHDGDLDILASADTDDEVAWWENTAGDASAWAKTSIQSAWDGAFDVWAADLDRDGDLDVLAASQSEDRISFWRNDGAGTFGPEETLGDPLLSSEGFFNQAYSVATADLDADGDLDVVGTAWKDGGKVAWWENLDGAAGSWQRHDVDGAHDGASSVFVADVDGDGRGDLLTTAETDGELTLWPNGGGQAAIAATATAATELGDSVTETLFTLELTPRGLISEDDVELASLAFLFEESVGDPLTSVEASSLVASVEVLADDGTTPGSVDAGDTSLTAVNVLTLTSGVLSLGIPDDTPAAAVAQGSTATFFVRLTTTADYLSQALGGLRVSHRSEAGPGQTTSAVEQWSNDIPLRLEWAPDTATATFPVSSADLATAVVPGTSPVTAGDDLSFTVTVTNTGPGNAQGVELALGLTGPATLVSTSGCAEDPTGLPACSIGTLANGGQAQVTVTVGVDDAASGSVSLAATASATSTDPDASDDSDTSEVPVVAVADLTLVKEGPATYSSSGPISYTLTVSNAGPGPASATVVDLFPAAVVGVSWTCAGTSGGICPATGGGDVNAAVSLPSGGQVSFTANGTVLAAYSAPIVNTASVSPGVNVTDPDPAGDADEATSTWTGLFADGFESGNTSAW
ncbi:MAG: FG-GAP-like repeat-containing protein [Holophagales bacterium]|nr:FG-GAP-like repeat-containing protein [Holophagales bacterium]